MIENNATPPFESESLLRGNKEDKNKEKYLGLPNSNPRLVLTKEMGVVMNRVCFGQLKTVRTIIFTKHMMVIKTKRNTNLIIFISKTHHVANFQFALSYAPVPVEHLEHIGDPTVGKLCCGNWCENQSYLISSHGEKKRAYSIMLGYYY